MTRKSSLTSARLPWLRSPSAILLSSATGTAASHWSLVWRPQKPKHTHALPELRPNGRNNRSFPSGHTSISFAAASYLHQRYGWEVGVPATFAAGLVASYASFGLQAPG
jgi:membrane-associated phospholipid phosphatase